ncbi:unnamed protein product, partial [marine sediment metagenome]
QLTGAGYTFYETEGTAALGEPIEKGFLIEGIDEFEARRIGNNYKQDSVLVPRGLLYTDKTYNPSSLMELSMSGTEESYYTVVQIGENKYKFAIPVNVGESLSIPKEEYLATKLGFIALLRKNYNLASVAADKDVSILSSTYHSTG